MRVAIIGAGPAGAHLASLLSQRGYEVLLFDARPAWEKPCGGGVTSKALREFDVFQGEGARRQRVSSLRLISAQNREVMLSPGGDFAVYSRTELGRLMRERAIGAGARLHCLRVERLWRTSAHWELETEEGSRFSCDFLVGADGATSVIRRRLGLQFTQRDFAYAIGWHVKPTAVQSIGCQSQERKPVVSRSRRTQLRPVLQTFPVASRADIKYLNELTGYIWAFPRTDHISYGIVTRYQEATPKRLKQLLLDFLALQDQAVAQEIKSSTGHSTPRATFYAAMIPALEASSWDKLKVCDARRAWALVGDAAGFADPITGEGIYYAIKSAELLAQALLTCVDDYDDMWRTEFGAELRRAAQIAHRFYHGRFAGAPLTERMVQLAKYHRGVRETLRDLIAGEQSYLDLKPRLCRGIFSLI